MTAIAQSILYSLTWFDIFDYPLTLEEIYWWFYGCETGDQKVSREQIRKSIESELQNIVQEKDNYYFLKNRQDIMISREQRYEYSRQKMRRVRKLQQFLKYFPFIKMVALCDFMGYMNAREESDIDLFIITEKNRLFSARFWLTGILKVLNLRPRLKSGIKKDKFCLSFWVTEEGMDLEEVALGFGKDEESGLAPTLCLGQTTFLTLGDIYFYYWLAGLKPIYNIDNCFKKFLQSNSWVKRYLPNLNQYYNSPNFLISQFPNFSLFRKLFQRFHLDFVEKILRWFQLGWMPRQLKELSKEGKSVIIKDNMLKLHWEDKREEFRERFISNLNMKLYGYKNGNKFKQP